MVVHHGSLCAEVDAARECFLELFDHVENEIRGGVQVEHDGDGEEGEHDSRRQPFLQFDELATR